jgi:hypothetical protein
MCVQQHAPRGGLGNAAATQLNWLFPHNLSHKLRVSAASFSGLHSVGLHKLHSHGVGLTSCCM